MQKPRVVIVSERSKEPFEKDSGFEVVRAETCEEADRILGQFPKPDLILSDQTLPDGNWCDVLRLAVRHKAPAELRVLGPSAGPIFRFDVSVRPGPSDAEGPASITVGGPF